MFIVGGTTIYNAARQIYTPSSTPQERIMRHAKWRFLFPLLCLFSLEGGYDQLRDSRRVLSACHFLFPRFFLFLFFFLPTDCCLSFLLFSSLLSWLLIFSRPVAPCVQCCCSCLTLSFFSFVCSEYPVFFRKLRGCLCEVNIYRCWDEGHCMDLEAQDVRARYLLFFFLLSLSVVWALHVLSY